MSRIYAQCSLAVGFHLHVLTLICIDKNSRIAYCTGLEPMGTGSSAIYIYKRRKNLCILKSRLHSKEVYSPDNNNLIQILIFQNVLKLFSLRRLIINKVNWIKTTDPEYINLNNKNDFRFFDWYLTSEHFDCVPTADMKSLT